MGDARTTLATLATVTPNVVSDINWKIVGVGDFYRDGHPDILWQHQATGADSVLADERVTLAELATVTPNRVRDTNWKIVGVGDFNRDGQPDILWQHQTTGALIMAHERVKPGRTRARSRRVCA